MDPLSVTASATALIGLANQVLTACLAYTAAVKDAPNDLCNILIEVGSVKCVLETLEVRQNLSPILQKLDIVHSPLEGCRRELDTLAQLLPSDVEDSRRRARGKSVLTKLTWPFKQGQARKVLENLGRHKGTFVLLLTTDAGQDIKIIKDNVEEIVNALTDQQRDSILGWLVKTDPSSNHNRACELHETHTGQWLFRSPHYNEWLSGPTRFLWLHGIPGAGKTILASFIIQEVKRFCNASGLSDLGWAYYYCYFGRNQDESRHFLCWIINQLCRQLKYVPGNLAALQNLGDEPSTTDLLNVLSILVKKFRRVYIVVDALDESRDRRFFLDLLIKIVGDENFQNISILVTSRKELDILQTLEGLCSSISLSNPLVDEDIRIYVESQLQTDHKFSRWPPFVRQEVRNALTKGAKGMFRWAACQLDILGRINSIAEIQKALKELPKTLEDTYERILVEIDPLNRFTAHKALQIIAAEHEPTLEELAEAAVVDVDQCLFTTDSRLLHPAALLEICSCLITVNEDGIVEFAHHTVLEYLTSPRIQDGSASIFKISKNEALILLTKIRIIYALNLPFNRLPSAKQVFRLDESSRDSLLKQVERRYPFIFRATLDWSFDIYQGRVPLDGSLIELSLRLLDPQEPHFHGFEEYITIYNRAGGDIFFRIKYEPGAESSMQLAYVCKTELVELAEALLKRRRNSSILENRLELQPEFHEHYTKFFEDVEGPPLQVAAMLRNPKMVELFLRYGANANASHEGWTVLTSTLRTRTRAFNLSRASFLEVIRLLLNAGANPNPSGVCKTPLQLAIDDDSDDNFEVVGMLLSAGALVNEVGSREAAIMDIEHRSATIHLRFDSASLGSYYYTPLLIIDTKISVLEDGARKQHRMEVERFSLLRDLLVKNGALHYSGA